MDKLSSGCKIIDALLTGGYEKGVISTLYGPAGSGKTNLAILCGLNAAKNGKIIFVDTEGGFSTERASQLFQKDAEKLLKNIIILEPATFEEQKKDFERIKKIVADEKISLIIVDSIVMLYRLNLKDDGVSDTNKELANQLSILSEIARRNKIPILVTNQVYAEFDKRDSIRMVGGDLLKYWSKCIVKLDKVGESIRKAEVVKHRALPEGKSVFFEIKENEIVEAVEPKRKFSLF